MRLRQTRHSAISLPAKGFTLLQALVCMAVIGTLSALATPALGNLLLRQRVLATQHALVAHLHLARASAIWRRKNTLLCPSTDGKQCASSADWGRGWLVFMDPDGNGRPDRHFDIIRFTLQPAPATLRVQGSSGRSSVRYLPDGRSAGSNMTISICDHTGMAQAKIVINNGGRVRSARPGASERCNVNAGIARNPDAK